VVTIGYDYSKDKKLVATLLPLKVDKIDLVCAKVENSEEKLSID